MDASQSEEANQKQFLPMLYMWKRTITVVAVILAILGVGFASYTIQTNEDAARVKIHRQEAKEIANSELEKRDLDPQNFVQSIAFQPRFAFTQAESYIAQYGTEQNFASALQITGWSSVGWTVSYAKDGEERAVKVRITPQGEVSSVNQIYPDDGKGANLDESQAREKVIPYLQEERGINPEQIEEQSVEQTQRANRTDYTFTYHVSSDSWKVNEANLAFQVDVEGNSVNGFSPRVDIPEEWRRTEATPNGGEFALLGLSFFLILGALGVVVWGFVYALREQVMMFNIGKWAAYVYIGIAILATLNALPRFTLPYGAGGISLNNFLAIAIGGKVVQIAFMAFVVFLAIALGIGAWKTFMSSYWGLKEMYTFDRGWNTPRIREILLTPLVISGIFVGSQFAIAKLAEVQNIYMPALSSNGFTQDLLTVLGTFIPAGAAVQGFVMSAVLLLGALGGVLVGKQVLQSWWKIFVLLGISVMLPTTGVLLITYPLSTVALLSLSTLINVCVIGLAVVLVLRTNLLAYVLMSIELMGLSMSAALLVQDDMWIRINGVILLVILVAVIYGGGKYGIPFVMQKMETRKENTFKDAQSKDQ